MLVMLRTAFSPTFCAQSTRVLLHTRARIGALRWLLAAVIGLLPVLVFQVSMLGIIFQGAYIRALVWGVTVLLVAVLVSPPPRLIEWHTLLGTLVLTGGLYAITGAFQQVTDYPFALTWSEGNRFWDYSILFGRERYIYPPDKEIYILLDPGRQWIGGLPFLFPGLTMLMQRAWLGLVDVLPYLTLGAVLFSAERGKPVRFLLAVLWVYLFLAQGPIHAPLVFSAALVAAAWRRSLWAAIPLAVAAGFLAGISRYTWMFAPAMWIAMLELSALRAPDDRPGWARIAALTLSALAAGAILPELIELARDGALSIQNFLLNTNASPQNIRAKISQQPLLWYRLFPNGTYGPGILSGLALAVGPLILLLLHLIVACCWRPQLFQRLAYGGVLAAFLGVGLTVSVKIGGGGDLHNLDMFLIGLTFLGAIAWQQGGRDWLMQPARQTPVYRLLVIGLVLLPSFIPVMHLRSYGYYEHRPWLAALTGESPQKLGLIPPRAVSDPALDTLQSYIRAARQQGDILFMDQRQLLTFGYIDAVPLVPEYDKKVLIERAFTQNRDYFERFYADLANRRFSLVIVQPQTIIIKASEAQFAEENNAWVHWVSGPLLCYYAVEHTLPEVNVQILSPRPEPVDCAGELP